MKGDEYHPERMHVDAKLVVCLRRGSCARVHRDGRRTHGRRRGLPHGLPARRRHQEHEDDQARRGEARAAMLQAARRVSAPLPGASCTPRERRPILSASGFRARVGQAGPEPTNPLSARTSRLCSCLMVLMWTSLSTRHRESSVSAAVGCAAGARIRIRTQRPPGPLCRECARPRPLNCGENRRKRSTRPAARGCAARVRSNASGAARPPSAHCSALSRCAQNDARSLPPRHCPLWRSGGRKQRC